MKQSIILALLLLFGASFLAAQENGYDENNPESDWEYTIIEADSEDDDIEEMFRELYSYLGFEYIDYSKLITDSVDSWFECTYSYAYTGILGDKYEMENKIDEITVAVNKYRLLFRLKDADDSTYSKPVPVELLEDESIYVSPKHNFGFDPDFSEFYLTGIHGTDAYELVNVEQLNDPLPFNPDDKPKTGIPVKLRYILLALLPAILLLIFLLWRDRLRPEPPKELIIAILMGLLTLPLAILFVRINSLFGLIGIGETWFNQFKRAFVGAAIPEEFAKLLILWMFFKWRKNQDEMMDGIVYAACIGLAFAAGENIKYIMAAAASQTTSILPVAASIGVTRAILSVPGHFCFAILMGYYFSFYLFSKQKRGYYLAMAFLIPMLFHGFYDFFAFMEELPSVWTTVISYSFYAVFFLMNNLCVKAIRKTLARDESLPRT
ncbi:MAG: PrsW family intramembrane metalloprotease [Bacteroidaceae bacterium]|nr:PrsW family intramembrane metalloprotease [Bacteroidaceae bacterium]